MTPFDSKIKILKRAAIICGILFFIGAITSGIIGWKYINNLKAENTRLNGNVSELMDRDKNGQVSVLQLTPEELKKYRGDLLASIQKELGEEIKAKNITQINRTYVHVNWDTIRLKAYDLQMTDTTLGWAKAFSHKSKCLEIAGIYFNATDSVALTGGYTDSLTTAHYWTRGKWLGVGPRWWPARKTYYQRIFSACPETKYLYSEEIKMLKK